MIFHLLRYAGLVGAYRASSAALRQHLETKGVRGAVRGSTDASRGTAVLRCGACFASRAVVELDSTDLEHARPGCPGVVRLHEVRGPRR